MEIQCPICSTSIEVAEAHLGHKGRCPTCESKFIIPVDADQEFEILERCELPEEGRESATGSPLVVPSRGAAPRRRAVMRPVTTQSNGSGMVIFGIVALCAAVGIAFIANKKNDSPDGKESTSLKNYRPAGDEEVGIIPIERPESTEVAAVVPTTSGIEPTTVSIEEEAEPEPMPEAVETEPEEMVSNLDESQRASALGFMKSNDRLKRAAAYKGFRDLGEREKVVYRQLLDEARIHHADILAKRAFDLGIADNILTKFREAYKEWQSVSEPAKKMAQTNWKEKSPKDYKKEHAEMDKLTEKAMELYARAVRAAKRASDFEVSGFQGGLDALAEINEEIAWSESETAEPSDGLRDQLSMAGGADDYLEILSMIDITIAMAAGLEEAESFNADSKWASGAYKAFATELNSRRVPLGLVALKLDENLSNACKDHSEDMAKHGYFSHTGRTEETKSFGDRARRAKFSGFATGECIFMGNASPSAAHRAWWYSDGHRLIMYAGGPNTLGLGLFGKHWTLNTGKM